MPFSKQKIYSACLDILVKKIENLSESFSLLSEAASNETKSSVGDKHETSRAMIQLEQEKIGKQLKEALAQKKELQAIDVSQAHTSIGKGSLVKTDKGLIFIGPGLGKVNADNEILIAVSSQSPLGQKLIGKKKNENIELNGIKYHIEEIF
jgi:hypothetical protein